HLGHRRPHRRRMDPTRRGHPMSVITRPCAGCGAPIRLTDTPSLYRDDGSMWPIYHRDCYQETHP
ncbi:MAG: hypothetical protein Q4B10_08045, partial [Actinomycetaceae bacterium]|nr:hypothetical protein [Actinomycetaceae bacterium]